MLGRARTFGPWAVGEPPLHAEPWLERAHVLWVCGGDVLVVPAALEVPLRALPHSGFKAVVPRSPGSLKSPSPHPSAASGALGSHRGAARACSRAMGSGGSTASPQRSGLCCRWLPASCKRSSKGGRETWGHTHTPGPVPSSLESCPRGWAAGLLEGWEGVLLPSDHPWRPR